MLLAPVLLAGCGDDRVEPSDLATPTAASECNQEPGQHGDMGSSVGLHWSGVEHGYDEPGEVFVCSFYPDHGGRASLAPVDGVSVDPPSVTVDATTGIARFEVRVERSADGEQVVATVDSSTSTTTERGPVIEAGDDGWRFVEPE